MNPVSTGSSTMHTVINGSSSHSEMLRSAEILLWPLTTRQPSLKIESFANWDEWGCRTITPTQLTTSCFFYHRPPNHSLRGKLYIFSVATVVPIVIVVFTALQHQRRVATAGRIPQLPIATKAPVRANTIGFLCPPASLVLKFLLLLFVHRKSVRSVSRKSALGVWKELRSHQSVPTMPFVLNLLLQTTALTSACKQTPIQKPSWFCEFSIMIKLFLQ